MLPLLAAIALVPRAHPPAFSQIEQRYPVVTFTRLPRPWRSFGGIGGAYATSWRYRPNSDGWAPAMPRNAIVIEVYFVRAARRYPPLRLVMPRRPAGFLEGTTDTPEYRIQGRVRNRNAEVRIDIRRRRPTRAQLRTAQHVLAGLRFR